MPDPDQAIAAALAGLGVEHRRTGPGAWTVLVPTEMRGGLAVVLAVGERRARLTAFFMRGADRRHEEFYRRLLRRHFDSYGWRFALDGADDVFLVADLPLADLDAPRLDELLGGLSTLVDRAYEPAMRLGFDVPAGAPVGPPPQAAADG